MPLADFFSIFTGRPQPGRLTLHESSENEFNNAVELAKRIEDLFGPPNKLRVADLGCGACSTPVGEQVLKIPFRRLISVEAFIPYIHQLKTKDSVAQTHDIMEGRIENVIEDFKLDDVDVVFLIEVLEHFSRKDALKLLGRLEKICRKGIMIFSPLGEIHREPKDQNALQRYRSSWTREDFAKLGYDVDVYQGFYRGFEPPLDAAWAVKKSGIKTTIPGGNQSAKAA